MEWQAVRSPNWEATGPGWALVKTNFMQQLVSRLGTAWSKPWLHCTRHGPNHVCTERVQSTTYTLSRFQYTQPTSSDSRQSRASDEKHLGNSGDTGARPSPSSHWRAGRCGDSQDRGHHGGRDEQSGARIEEAADRRTPNSDRTAETSAAAAEAELSA